MISSKSRIPLEEGCGYLELPSDTVDRIKKIYQEAGVENPSLRARRITDGFLILA